MKKRRIHWRRKNKKIIAEGIKNKRLVYLFTLPTPELFVRLLLAYTKGSPSIQKNKSFMTQENLMKIKEKIDRLDYKDKKGVNVV